MQLSEIPQGKLTPLLVALAFPRAVAIPHRGLGQILNFMQYKWDFTACVLLTGFLVNTTREIRHRGFITQSVGVCH